MSLRLCLSLVALACFTTRAAAFNFSVSKLNGVTLTTATTLQFGPDNRLYVAQVDGQIKALTVQRAAPNNYQVTATEIINLVRDIPNYDDDGPRNFTLTTRQVTGLLVVGTAANPILYVTSSDPRIGGGSGGENDLNLDTNSSIISRLTFSGGVWTKVDLVRGLPRSEENHAANGLQLDATTNTLYLAQGGNTNAGGPSVNFAYMGETALSGAILSIDLNALNAMPVKTDAYGQKYVYDLPTLDDPNPARAHNPDGSNVNDPFGGNDGLNQAKLVPGGPVQIYAPGFRNPYDLLITRTPGHEGRLYTFDNGANPGWGGYPKNEGPGGTVTNEYVSGEPGFVNNKDNLHLITGRGYYGGHPNPLRANPAGAGWFHYDNNLPAGSQMVYSTSPTSDWPAVPVSMANPIEGDFRQPGPENGALLLNNASTNGLAEYVATNFSGEMQGNLIAASYDGRLLRIALSADGTAVTNGLETLASGFGALPLDVTTPDPGHGAPFVGTIWVAHYQPGKVSILEPADFDSPGSSTCTGINSFDVDEDGDGFSNADEIANGTDPCSAAIRPPDFDNDHISDKLDPDDDNDGIPDVSDPFPLDPTNGRSVPLPVHYELFNETGIGFFGVGFTGLMMNRGEDYLQRISPDNIVAGGTAGLFTISEVGSGTARGSTNNLKDAYQFAFNSDEFTPPYVVSSRLAGPFFASTPTGNQTQGIYLGYGDQDNYVSVALHANGGAGGLEVVYEVGGTVAFQQLYPFAGLAGLSTIDFAFTVDPLVGSVQPGYRLPDATTFTPLGSPILVSGDVLMALMGKYPLAIGAFASTGGGGAPTFSATWDWFDVAPLPSTALAKITIDPPGSNMVTASTYNAGSFKIQNLSTGGQNIQSVTFDLSTSIFPDMVFDVTGTAGDSVFKPFDPDSATSGVSFQAATMIQPHNGSTADDGYDGVDVHFNAFPAGGTFTFSIDIDPNNVKGVAQPGENDSASVSGLELIGGTASVYFDDGSVQRTRFGRVEGSVDGAYGWARADKPPKPGVVVVGQASPLKTNQAAQTVRVSGPAGLSVSLVVVEGGLYLAGVPGGGYHVHPYEANTAVKVTEYSGVLSPSGLADIPVTLTQTDPKAGYNFITATLADGNGIKGPASANLVIQYDPAYTGGDTQPPTAPDSLNATDVTMRSATLGWNASSDNTGVTGYDVLRDGVVVTTISGLTYTDFGLDPGVTYTYSIVARDSAGNASPAATLPVTTTNGGTVVLRVNAGGPAYTDAKGNTWSADFGFNTGTTATTTKAIDRTIDDPLFKSERNDGTTTPELTYSFNVPNGQYEVQLFFTEVNTPTSGPGLRVFDVSLEGQLALDNYDIFAAAGVPATAVMATATTTVTDGQLNLLFTHGTNNPKINAIKLVKLPSESVPPTTPGNFAASNITPSSVTLTWDTSTDNVGVTGYLLSRNGAAIQTTTALTYTDTGLAGATAYSYSIVATDAAGNLSPAATLNVTTATPPPDTQPPTAPGALTFTNVTATSAQLNWTAATDDVGVTGYRIARDGTELTTVTGLIYNDTGLTPSTAYAYSVVALDAAGHTSSASTGSVTTGAPPAQPPIRINTGGASYVDTAGNTWAADAGFNTGNTTTSTATVAGTTEPTLFKSERYDPSTAPELTYTFNVANGSYLVKLYFAETYGPTKGAGLRVFDVNIQSTLAFDNVDIFSQAGGGDKALVLQASATVTDGTLKIGFIHQTENPKINAIEIIPTSGGGGTDTTPPSAPTNLASSAITATGATLNWSASTDNVGVTGYRISRGGALLTTVTGTSFADSGLSPGTTYAYSVVALDAAGNFSPAATINVTTTAATDTTPPSAPGSLTFSNVTSNSVTVNWTAATDNVGVTGYRVSRDGTVLTTVTGLSFSDGGLAASTTYAYSVVALDAAGNVSTASSASVATGAGGTLPTIRVNTGGGAYTDTVGNTWSADTGFNTGKSSTESGNVTGTPYNTLFKTVRFDETPAPELTYAFTVPNGSYIVRLYFAETSASGNGAGLRVFHVNLQGQRAFTDVDIYAQAGGMFKPLILERPTIVSNGQVQITFLHKTNNPRISAIEILPNGGGSSDTVAPSAPTNLAAFAVTSSSLTLTWTAATDNVGVTGYRVSRDGTVLNTVTTTSFDDSSLSPNTTYAYSVVALDAAGNASAPATLNATTSAAPDVQAPSAPTNLAASAVTSSSLTLTWTAATDNVGVTGYRVSRDGTVLNTVTTTSFDDSSLSPNTTYAYSVVALDAAGNASAPATLNVTTSAAPDAQAPSAPTNLAVSAVTSSSLTLTWTAATDNVGVTGYRVSRDGTLLNTVTATSFDDSGLSPNTTYAYSVVALDAAGNASAPATLNVTTSGGGSALPTIRINAGGPAYTDTAGTVWAADSGFNTGKASTEMGTVSGTPSPTLFKTVRFDEAPAPELSYTFSLPNGAYTVRLYFAETAASGSGTGLRVFNIDLQGQRAFTNVDIYTQAGGAFKPLILEQPVTVAGGQVQITLLHVKNNPRISAIEIIPAP